MNRVGASKSMQTPVQSFDFHEFLFYCVLFCISRFISAMFLCKKLVSALVLIKAMNCLGFLYIHTE